MRLRENYPMDEVSCRTNWEVRRRYEEREQRQPSDRVCEPSAGMLVRRTAFNLATITASIGIMIVFAIALGGNFSGIGLTVMKCAGWVVAASFATMGVIECWRS